MRQGPTLADPSPPPPHYAPPRLASAEGVNAALFCGWRDASCAPGPAPSAPSGYSIQQFPSLALDWVATTLPSAPLLLGSRPVPGAANSTAAGPCPGEGCRLELVLWLNDSNTQVR